MPPALIVAAVGLGAAAVGTVASISNATKSANRQKEASKLDQQRNNLAAAKERRDAIRAARQAYATAAQAGENQGASTTSASQGGLSSIGSQINSNLSFLDGYKALTDAASVQLGQAAAFNTKANMWGSVAAAGKSVANSSTDIAAIFKG